MTILVARAFCSNLFTTSSSRAHVSGRARGLATLRMKSTSNASLDFHAEGEIGPPQTEIGPYAILILDIGGRCRSFKRERCLICLRYQVGQSDLCNFA